MSKNDDVAAVLADLLDVWGVGRVNVVVDEALAALATAGYAIVKLPEGVAVAHGARLKMGYGAECIYAIEAP